MSKFLPRNKYQSEKIDTTILLQKINMAFQFCKYMSIICGTTNESLCKDFYDMIQNVYKEGVLALSWFTNLSLEEDFLKQINLRHLKINIKLYIKKMKRECLIELLILEEISPRNRFHNFLSYQKI